MALLLNLLQQIKVHIRQSKSTMWPGAWRGQVPPNCPSTFLHRLNGLMYLVIKVRLLSGLIWMANEESKVLRPKQGVHFQWAYHI